MSTIAASPRELLRIRRDTDRTFDRQVEVWRVGNTPDGKGSQVESRTRHSSGPGRIAPLTNREGTYAEAVIGDRLGGRQPFMVTVAQDRNLRMADQLRIDGSRFEIITIDRPRSYAADRRVVAAEIT